MKKLPRIKERNPPLLTFEIPFVCCLLFFQNKRAVGSQIGCFKIFIPLGTSFKRDVSCFK